MNSIYPLGVLVFVVFLLAYEGYALKTGKVKTISRITWEAGQKWPLLWFLIGLVVGGLMVHFTWHWCPGGGQGVGLLLLPGWSPSGS